MKLDVRDKEIFDAIDREQELLEELKERSQAFKYVAGIDDFQRHIAFAIGRIDEIRGKLELQTWDQRAFDAMAEVQFFLFSLGSVHLSLETHLYCGTDDLGVKRICHPLIDEWKMEAPVQLIKAYRNRLQHRHYAAASISVSTAYSMPGAKPIAYVKLSLCDSDIEKVLRMVAAASRDQCSALLGQVKERQEGLLVLLEAYRDALGGVAEKLRDILERECCDEFVRMRHLVEEIDKVRSVQARYGLHDPMQPAKVAIEMCARAWSRV